MGIVVDFRPTAQGGAAGVAIAPDEAQAARLLADLEIAKARADMDMIAHRVGDPLAVEIHAIRRALALLDLTLHASVRSTR